MGTLIRCAKVCWISGWVNHLQNQLPASAADASRVESTKILVNVTWGACRVVHHAAARLRAQPNPLTHTSVWAGKWVGPAPHPSKPFGAPALIASLGVGIIWVTMFGFSL